MPPSCTTATASCPPPLQALVRWTSRCRSVRGAGPGVRRFRDARAARSARARGDRDQRRTAAPGRARRTGGPRCRACCSSATCPSARACRAAASLAKPVLANVPLQLTLAGGGDIAGYRATGAPARRATRSIPWLGDAGPGRAAAGATDVLVLPSHDEGLPLAILEALATASPWSARRSARSRTCCPHGHTRLLRRAGAPASIARGLAQVLTDAQLRERLERKGQALYQAQFSLLPFRVQHRPHPPAHVRPVGAAARRTAGAAP